MSYRMWGLWGVAMRADRGCGGRGQNAVKRTVKTDSAASSAGTTAARTANGIVPARRQALGLGLAAPPQCPNLRRRLRALRAQRRCHRVRASLRARRPRSRARIGRRHPRVRPLARQQPPRPPPCQKRDRPRQPVGPRAERVRARRRRVCPHPPTRARACERVSAVVRCPPPCTALQKPRVPPGAPTAAAAAASLGRRPTLGMQAGPPARRARAQGMAPPPNPRVWWLAQVRWPRGSGSPRRGRWRREAARRRSLNTPQAVRGGGRRAREGQASGGGAL